MLSRTITGTILITFGIFLIAIGFNKVWAITIYGALSLVIGLLIISNKNEDQIEQIKEKEQDE